MNIVDFKKGDIVVIESLNGFIKKANYNKVYNLDLYLKELYPIGCVGEVVIDGGSKALKFFDFMNDIYSETIKLRKATKREEFLYKIYGAFVSK